MSVLSEKVSEENEDKMLYLVTGGSGSGKSEYAEKLAQKIRKGQKEKGRFYYIATMYPYDQECLERIKKHRNMRADKGFETIECYTQLEKISVKKTDVVLLECMSNLLANEMYQPDGRIRLRGTQADAQLHAAIIRPLLQMAENAGGVVVVSNEVFSDGGSYDGETKEYVRLLGTVNTQLAASADGVVEAVCGIPVIVKKGEKECFIP